MTPCAGILTCRGRSRPVAGTSRHALSGTSRSQARTRILEPNPFRMGGSWVANVPPMKLDELAAWLETDIARVLQAMTDGMPHMELEGSLRFRAVDVRGWLEHKRYMINGLGGPNQ